MAVLPGRVEPVHPAFAVMESALSGARLDPAERGGTIVFRVLGPGAERVRVSLASTCTLEQGDGEADLAVYCDAAQLSEMIAGRPSPRPLRTHGDRHLLDVLSTLLRPAKDPLSIRGGR